MAWVVDHLADLESDFSRFHRVDDIYALDGPRFMRMAWRISVYEGVISMRMRAEQTPDNSVVPEDHRATSATSDKKSGRGPSVKRLAATAVAFPDVFDVRKAR